MITLPACQNIACLPDNGRMQNFEMLAWSLPHTRRQNGSSEEEAVSGLLLRRHLPGHMLPYQAPSACALTPNKVLLTVRWP